ncbi:hypothetical protein V1514DRAFT_331821 [Lipomyces japonicus]|uniref:uncharacterized protein n=1 Tax=Lipomyces japonicus TaxID=56871 RepID=UPI0034CFB14F
MANSNINKSSVFKGKASAGSELESAASRIAVSATGLFSSLATSNVAPDNFNAVISGGKQFAEYSSFKSSVIAEAATSSKISRAPATSSPGSESAGFRSNLSREQNSVAAQREYDSFLENNAVAELPSNYIDLNDGGDVVAFLASDQYSQLVNSFEPDTNHAPTPTPAQLGYNQVLADITLLSDPVEYLLNTDRYTEDVWGDYWETFQSARKDHHDGRKEEARKKIQQLLKNIKPKL